jgi:flagellar biosynthetic protein FliR
VSIPVNYLWLASFLLVLARTIPWLLAFPPFSGGVVPKTATLGIAGSLALLIAPSLPAASIPTTTDALIGDLLFQVLTGAALGFVINILLSTVAAAGGFLDLVGGLNLPTAIDPLGLDQTPILGQFYEQIMVLLLFVSGGYLYMIQGFKRSFTMSGYSLATSNRVALVMIDDLSTFFVSALEIAAPVLAVLFTTQIILGLLSKAAPQLNVWIMGMPLQIFLSLLLVAVAVNSLPAFVGNILDRVMADTTHLFSGY